MRPVGFEQRWMGIVMVALLVGATVGCGEEDAPQYFTASEGSDSGVQDEIPAAIFATIEAGSFTMGSASDEPGRDENEVEHEVTLTREFQMQATEVTQEQWKALMGRDPSDFPACGGDCPVEQVSWFDAIVYCNALSRKEGLARCYEDPDDGTDYDGSDASAQEIPEWPEGLDCEGYRLPTEAEWEYAARAGTTTAFNTGPVTAADTTTREFDANLDSAGWYGGNSHAGYAGAHECSDWYEDATKCGPQPVGTREPNAWDLYDMHGNVFEWVWDGYGDSAGSVTDPVGSDSASSRVTRGGAWGSPVRDCRSAFRNQGTPDYVGNGLGLRPVRSLF